MTKLSPSLVEYITDVVAVANQFNIDTLIIEPGRVRAMDTRQTAIILHTQGVPDLPCKTLCIPRVKEFSNRLEMVRKQPNPEFSIVCDGTDEYAQTVLMKAKGLKTDFRCSQPHDKMAPKRLNDPFVHEIKISPDLIPIIQNGKTAMSTDDVIIAGDDKYCQLSMKDRVHGDIFTYDLDIPVMLVDTDEPFRHVFDAKQLLMAFKTTTSTTFSLSEKGFLKINYNSIDMYIFPKE